MPQPLYDVLNRLTDLLVIGVPTSGSDTGMGFEHESAQLDRWLDSADAAELLGYSAEYTRRIAEALGGRRFGRRWMIPRRGVQQHVNGKELGA